MIIEIIVVIVLIIIGIVYGSSKNSKAIDKCITRRPRQLSYFEDDDSELGKLTKNNTIKNSRTLQVSEYILDDNPKKSRKKLKKVNFNDTVSERIFKKEDIVIPQEIRRD